MQADERELRPTLHDEYKRETIGAANIPPRAGTVFFWALDASPMRLRVELNFAQLTRGESPWVPGLKLH
jgi:hypothetical protein